MGRCRTNSLTSASHLESKSCRQILELTLIACCSKCSNQNFLAIRVMACLVWNRLETTARVPYKALSRAKVLVYLISWVCKATNIVQLRILKQPKFKHLVEDKIVEQWVVCQISRHYAKISNLLVQINLLQKYSVDRLKDSTQNRYPTVEIHSMLHQPSLLRVYIQLTLGWYTPRRLLMSEIR